MKANEFVKKFGLNTAKSVLSNENSKSCRFYCHSHECGLMIPCQVWVDDPKDSNVDFVSLDELEKLIESHELVKEFGGLGEAKEYIHYHGEYEAIYDENGSVCNYASNSELIEAIADVESCTEAGKRLEVNQ